VPARKIPNRVCVIAGRQNWTPFIGSCRGRDHGHITGIKAAQLVDQGSAEWVATTWTDRSNKEHRHAEPAIRLIGRKRWKGVISGWESPTPMKVMQLVSN
jgi:hypothetical protein